MDHTLNRQDSVQATGLTPLRLELASMQAQAKRLDGELAHVLLFVFLLPLAAGLAFSSAQQAFLLVLLTILIAAALARYGGLQLRQVRQHRPALVEEVRAELFGSGLFRRITEEYEQNLQRGPQEESTMLPGLAIALKDSGSVGAMLREIVRIANLELGRGRFRVLRNDFIRHPFGAEELQMAILLALSSELDIAEGEHAAVPRPQRGGGSA